jgi:hypothetical protein
MPEEDVMDELELWARGLMTSGLGPDLEWSPVPVAEHAARHDTFWKLVADLLKTEPGEYDDLPKWMTEAATEALLQNN